MYHNKIRRKKFRSNNKHFRRRPNGDGHRHQSPNFISNGQLRGHNFKGPQNIQRLVDKYNSLAKEALSTGDKILSENYLQHADHFSRIAISNAEKVNNVDKKENTDSKVDTESDSIDQKIDKKIIEDKVK